MTRHKRISITTTHTRMSVVSVLLTVTALFGIAGCSTGVSGAAPPSTTRTTPTKVAIPVGSSTHSMTLDGMQRTYRVYRPKLLPASAPLVVMLHGALGTGRQAESSYGWDARADAGHFIVAYPDGYKRTWDVSDGCCGPASAQHVDDVAFVTEMVKSISASLPVDRDRVYATGVSNGGALAYRLACDTTVFAAIGPDSTDLLGTCPSPAPISVIHIHGTADQTFPYAGGPGRHDNGGTGERPADTAGPPIPQLIDRWRGIDHCAAPKSGTSGGVTTSLAACPGGRAVELVTIVGAGHQWPGQPGPRGALAEKLDPPYPGLDATAVIWDFFRAHPKAP